MTRREFAKFAAALPAASVFGAAPHSTVGGVKLDSRVGSSFGSAVGLLPDAGDPKNSGSSAPSGRAEARPTKYLSAGR